MAFDGAGAVAQAEAGDGGVEVLDETVDEAVQGGQAVGLDAVDPLTEVPACRLFINSANTRMCWAVCSSSGQRAWTALSCWAWSPLRRSRCRVIQLVTSLTEGFLRGGSSWGQASRSFRTYSLTTLSPPSYPHSRSSSDTSCLGRLPVPTSSVVLRQKPYNWLA